MPKTLRTVYIMRRLLLCFEPQVPPGTAGILGLDFLTLFDWDFDIAAQKAG